MQDSHSNKPVSVEDCLSDPDRYKLCAETTCVLISEKCRKHSLWHVVHLACFWRTILENPEVRSRMRALDWARWDQNCTVER